MSDIKRYGCSLSWVNGRTTAGMYESPEGGYVAYADIAPLLAERDQTPVDAEWLDGVMVKDNESTFGVSYRHGDVEVIIYYDDNFDDLLKIEGVFLPCPTRGDVLTALRLFKERE